MKILLISTSVYRLTKEGVTGYGGLEYLVAKWAMELKKLGVDVSVVCPEGSDLGEGIEIIPVGYREGFDSAYLKYKDRLAEFDAIQDNSWGWYSVLSQMEADRQLPIIHIYHTDYANLSSPPPIQYPCIVTLSNDQAEGIRRKWGVAVRVNFNGIDLSFYKANPELERSNRYLWIGRYTPEKMPLETILLAKKCRIPLDMYGDLEIIASQDYANKCFNETDGRQIRVNPGISREEVVKQMQSHKALIHMVSYNEAFGLVPVEAMACGLPVIVNRRGALPELVKNSKTGFVVDTLEQAEELIKTDAISKLKPEDCIRQAKKFSIQASAKGHLQLLQDVANGIYW